MANGKQDDLFEVGRKRKGKATLPQDRDLVFDAIAVACGWDPGATGKRNGNKVGMAAAELRAEGVLATQADYNVILAVAAEYAREKPKLCVGGYPTPLGLSGNFHAYAHKVKQSRKTTQEATPYKAQMERMERERQEWFSKRMAIVEDIVAQAPPSEVETIWLNLKKSMQLPKKAKMSSHLGKIAEAIAPGELARRLETDNGN